MIEAWRHDLEVWLAPFLTALINKARASMCPVYVSGLIGLGDRKSIQPMAARGDHVSYDRLHHFINAGVWDLAPLEAVLWQRADELVDGEDAWLIIDDTSLPKKGTASVGVAPQNASALGKTSNCQTLVSMTLASGEVPVMIGLRLFLPESWTGDVARLDRGKVQIEYRAPTTKPEIALCEIDRARAAGVRFGCVLADAGYGMSSPFRRGLSERGLGWVVGIPSKQKVYPADVRMIFPVAEKGRPRKRHSCGASIPFPSSSPGIAVRRPGQGPKSTQSSTYQPVQIPEAGSSASRSTDRVLAVEISERNNVRNGFR